MPSIRCCHSTAAPLPPLFLFWNPSKPHRTQPSCPVITLALVRKKHAGVIFVHDVTNAKSALNLFRWVQEFKNALSDAAREDFQRNMPKLVVGTKLDLLVADRPHGPDHGPAAPSKATSVRRVAVADSLGMCDVVNLVRPGASRRVD